MHTKMHFRWLTLLLLLLVALLVACGGTTPADTPATESEPAAVEEPAAEEEVAEEPTPEEEMAEEPTPEEEVAEEPTAEEPAVAGDRVQVRWFVGLGTGSNADQIAGQEAVVEAFNASQDEIQLVVEFVDNAQATDVLLTQIAAGNSPDIIGPVGTAGRAAFTDALLDLQPLIEATNFDLSDFDPAMVDFYEIQDQGQIGLPFAVFPSFIYFNKDLFDEAGLPYPPQEYGQPYVDVDGNEKPWNMDTVRELAMLLTVDANGNDATSPDFDPENIVQFGYGVQYTDFRGRATLFGPGWMMDESGNAVIPDHWADAMQWYHDAMWVDHFYPNAIYGNSDLLNAGNWFESGNLAMDHVHLWYATCCTGGLEAEWDIAVMPAAPDGTITAKMHADTFAILEGSKNPEAAFEVLTYLIGDAVPELSQIYGGLPARLSLQEQYFDTLNANQFAGSEKTWSVVTDSMAYPDNPNHEEGYPGELQVRDALVVFDEQLNNNPDFDVQAGLEELRNSLQQIFDNAQ